MTVRTGPCSPWIDGDALADRPAVRQALANGQKTAQGTTPSLAWYSDDEIAALLAMVADTASTILYQKSGKQFTGNCGPVTIRPVFRPPNADTRGWVFAGGGGWGYGWGASAMGNLGMPPVLALYAEERGPEIGLPDFPVNEILEVKIDGVVIPPEEYELRANRWLLRTRPTADYVPTQRWGWPTSQIVDLPDTQQGTFSVTYMFGQDPGEGGRMAAGALGEFIVLSMLGGSGSLPQRTTTITRQGVTAQVASVLDVSEKGLTGVYLADLWLNSVNPKQLQRRPRVWSPDIGIQQRQQTPTRS